MRRYCIGCFPRDKLPENADSPFALVANTETAKQKGEHWVAIFVDRNGCGEYFDSYGRKPLSTFARYLTENAPNGWKTALDSPVQSIFSTTCGQHCLYYLYNKCRGRTTFPFVSDEEVCNFVNRKFSLSLTTYDPELICLQVCNMFCE